MHHLTATPFYVLHYRQNIERKRYLDHALAAASILPRYITDFDREEIDLEMIYNFDEQLFLQMIQTIWPVMIGYAAGLCHPNASWKECIARLGSENLSFEQALERNLWLHPYILAPAAVSVFLKHREAWRQIADQSDDYALIAEDDIVLDNNSAIRLSKVLDALPVDADYIDIAGGCDLFPRAGNKMVNEFFFRMEPPRDRTACCAVISKLFAQRLSRLDMPICLPIDWSLTYAFNKLNAAVYWVEPAVFGHGSMIGAYQS